MVEWEKHAFTIVNFIISYVAYPVIAFVLYKVGLTVRAFIDTLWVEGKPNEWVVIMSGGKQKQAGIGLNTIVGPFDQVAIFPSKLNKVEVRTQ